MTTITLLGFDLETLGMAPPAAVIEVGWSSLKFPHSVFANAAGVDQEPPLHGARGGSVLFGIPEDQTMPPDNRAIHHIDPATLTGLPLFSPEGFGDAGMDDAEYAFAHNAEFEQQWLTAITRPWICTYKVALRVLPDAPSHGNQALKYELGIADCPAHHPPHRALPDCIVTGLVLEQLVRIVRERNPTLSLRDTLDRMVAITAEPRLLPRITFGKHRGQAWSEVPFSYLSWIMGSDMEADIKWNADREITRRRQR